MIHDKQFTDNFWHDQKTEKAPVDEVLVFVTPDFLGIGYIDQYGLIQSSDNNLDGVEEDLITYWAELPDYPNAY